MPVITTRPIQLPEDVGMYLDALRNRFPAIAEVWLYGPRVNEPENRGAHWDLLAFADRKVLKSIRGDPECHRDDVNLAVVVDGDVVERAFGDGEPRRLGEMEWRLDDLHSATYLDGGQRESALRVR